jgi:acetyl esterase/lipase
MIGAACTVVVMSCGGSSDNPTTVPSTIVGSVVIAPDSIVLLPGRVAQLTVTVRDAKGAALSGRSVTWSSADNAKVAISQTGDPTGTYYVYDFEMPLGKFNDYPHLGVWPDGYYMTDNQFNAALTAFVGAGVFSFERAKMLAGAIALSGPLDFAITGDLVPVFGDPAQWPRAQPLNFVDGDEPPFLLIHGLRDKVVEAEDSRLFAARLERMNVPVTLRLLPEGTHSTPLVGLYKPIQAPEIVPAINEFVSVCRQKKAR